MVFHELCFADQEASKKMEEAVAKQKIDFREHLERLKKIGQLTEEEVEQIWKSEGLMEPESDVEQVQVWHRWDHGRISGFFSHVIYLLQTTPMTCGSEQKTGVLKSEAR